MENKGGNRMFGYIANIGHASLVLILVIALIIFGLANYLVWEKPWEKVFMVSKRNFRR